MRYVDVRVPQLARTYDFLLDEKVPVEDVMESLMQNLLGEERNGLLFSVQNKRLLIPARTLEEQEILSGQTLVLFWD